MKPTNTNLCYETMKSSPFGGGGRRPVGVEPTINKQKKMKTNEHKTSAMKHVCLPLGGVAEGRGGLTHKKQTT